MRPLWLDYKQKTPGRQRTGWVLLALGVATAVPLQAYYFSLQAEADELELQVSHLRREAGPERRPGGDSRAAATASAESPAGRPLGGWEALFASLEAAGNDCVTLLSIQPGINAIQITGEAEDMDAALDYTKRLQSANGIGNVHLTQTEIIENNPQHPVRFSLAASWKEAAR